MHKRRTVRLSKLLSRVLRHDPGRFGLELDAHGWVDVERLLDALGQAGFELDRAALLEIVATSDKQRFALADGGRRIRANQGHSVEIDLGYPPAVPPDRLFHGTARDKLAKIRAQGLRRGRRHHVHLSAAPATALAVGRRHGAAVVLVIDARRQHADGHEFYVADNGVWLVERVPPEYIEFPAEQSEQ